MLAISDAAARADLNADGWKDELIPDFRYATALDIYLGLQLALERNLLFREDPAAMHHCRNEASQKLCLAFAAHQFGVRKGGGHGGKSLVDSRGDMRESCHKYVHGVPYGPRDRQYAQLSCGIPGISSVSDIIHC